VHAPVKAAGPLGFFPSEARQRQSREGRVVVNESRGPTLRTSPVRSRGSLPPAESLQGPKQGRGIGLEQVNGAGAGQVPGWGDHPDREVIVWDLQLHCPVEELNDRRAELPAREELESRAERAVVDELFTGRAAA
jgi:hypothetical protein